MVGAASFLGLSVILCLTDTVVSLFSKCRVASFRVVGSFSSSCDIQFGYTTAPPDWIDQLQVVESFKNATDGQLDAFAKEACRCRMLRVHRLCPSDLFELIKGVAWRCFPGARDAIRKGIEDTVRAQGQPSSEGEDVGRLVHQLRGGGSGDGDQGSTYNLQTENEGEETKEEGYGTEEMSTTASAVASTVIDGGTVIANGEDESSDTTFVYSVPPEESVKISSEDSSVDVTGVPTLLEGMGRGSTEEITESIPDDISGAGLQDTESTTETILEDISGPRVQDSTEEPDGGSTGDNENGNDASDSGSGEVEEEYDYEDSFEDLELESSAGEEAP